MPSALVDESGSSVNGVDPTTKVNGVKTNGVHTDESSVTTVDGADTSSTSDSASDDVAVVAASEKTEDETKKKEEEESEDEKEMKARKKELDALNAEYKDVAHGSKAEVVHLDKVHQLLSRIFVTRSECVPYTSDGTRTGTSTTSGRRRLRLEPQVVIGGRSTSWWLSAISTRTSLKRRRSKRRLWRCTLSTFARPWPQLSTIILGSLSTPRFVSHMVLTSQD
jgi:hypothetical protein